MKKKIFYFVTLAAIFVSIYFFPYYVFAEQQTSNRLIFLDKDKKEVIQELKTYLKKNPEDGNRRIELGKIFLEENMFQEAVVEFEKAVSSNPSNERAFLLLASTLLKASKPDFSRIVLLLEKAGRIAPQNADVHLQLAQAYTHLEKENEAEEAFKKASNLSESPTVLLSAYLGLMAIYKDRGQDAEANEFYQKALAIYPDIKGMLKQADINLMAEGPQYQGSLKGDGVHPLPEDRARRLKEKFPELLKDE